MSEERIKPLQELFCRYYTQNSHTFNNATESYAAAYDIELDGLSTQNKKDEKTGKEIPNSSPYYQKYMSCAVSASRLLKKDKINRRCDELLHELATDVVVDGELAWVIRQRKKLDSKVAAIREFNKLKGRIVEKQDLTTDGEKISMIVYKPEKYADPDSTPAS